MMGATATTAMVVMVVAMGGATAWVEAFAWKGEKAREKGEWRAEEELGEAAEQASMNDASDGSPNIILRWLRLMLLPLSDIFKSGVEKPTMPARRAREGRCFDPWGSVPMLLGRIHGAALL